MLWTPALLIQGRVVKSLIKLTQSYREFWFVTQFSVSFSIYCLLFSLSFSFKLRLISKFLKHKKWKTILCKKNQYLVSFHSWLCVDWFAWQSGHVCFLAVIAGYPFSRAFLTWHVTCFLALSFGLTLYWVSGKPRLHLSVVYSNYFQAQTTRQGVHITSWDGCLHRALKKLWYQLRTTNTLTRAKHFIIQSENIRTWRKSWTAKWT